MIPDVKTDIALLAAPCDEETLATLFTRWRTHGAPTVEQLVIAAGEALSLSSSHVMFRAACMAAQLADAPHPAPYHNTHHFREVVACTFRLLAADDTFDKHQAAMLLCAAAAHDLGHDGGQNNGHAFRLEDIAFTRLLPVLQRCGVAQEDVGNLHLLLRATDISIRPLLQDLYDHQPVTLPAALADFENNATLQHMAACLCDADLTPTTGTTRAFSHSLATLLRQENPAVIADDAALAHFIHTAMGGRFISHTATRLNGAALRLMAASL